MKKKNIPQLLLVQSVFFFLISDLSVLSDIGQIREYVYLFLWWG